MSVNDKKIIVNIPSENLDLIEKAALSENRPRNNFVLTAALEKAKLILQKNSGAITNDRPN